MDKRESRNRYLFGNTIIFAISNIATKFISFFLVPLYTNVLTTSEYGIVDLLYTICSFLMPLFTLNISEAILRFSLDKSQNKTDIINISFIIIIVSILMSLITIPIISYFDIYSKYSIYFYFYLITLGVSQILLVTLKGQEKLKLYAIGNILYVLFIAIFNILFLLFFNLKIEGYFCAYIISNVLISLFAINAGKIRINTNKFAFNKVLFKEMTRYSIVLIPTSFLWWIMNFADRIMVTKYVGLEANGIYGISYKIPTLLTAASSIFTSAWLFSAINEEKASDSEKYTNIIFNNLFYFIILAAMILIIAIKPLFKVYISHDFFEAWKYVPFLMVGYVFLTLSTFLSTSYNVHKDSKGFLFSALLGAIINIILNFILIPKFNVYGAAFATTISYISVFLYRLFDTSKYTRILFNKEYIILFTIFIITNLLIYIDSIFVIFVECILLFFTILIYKEKIINLFILLKQYISKKKN